MSRKEKLEKILVIDECVQSLSPPNYKEFAGTLFSDPVLKITTPTGGQVSVPMRTEDHPNYGLISHESDLEWMDQFVNALEHRPDLKSEFARVVSKFVSKVTYVLAAAEKVGRAVNLDGKVVSKLHERYKNDPLYQVELERVRRTEALMRERVELCVELGLCDRPWPRRDYKQLPSNEEISKALEAESPHGPKAERGGPA